MTNTTGVLHVLVGTYDLLDFRTLNGQAARRGYDIHFPRYQVQHEADRKAFQGALHALLLHIPLQMDMQDLMDHWYYFYERSIGCVGVLKDWFVRAYHAALRSRLPTLTLTHMQTQTLTNARCESMIADANAAEQKLHYTESSRERLWSLLGMSGIPLSGVQPADRQAEMSMVAPSRSRKGRVGERAPVRDPVGETLPEGEATKCSFAGIIELSGHRKWRKLEFRELSARSVSPCVLLPHKEQRCDFRPMTNERRGRRTVRCAGSGTEPCGRSPKRRRSSHLQHALSSLRKPG